MDFKETQRIWKDFKGFSMDFKGFPSPGPPQRQFWHHEVTAPSSQPSLLSCSSAPQLKKIQDNKREILKREGGAAPSAFHNVRRKTPPTPSSLFM